MGLTIRTKENKKAKIQCRLNVKVNLLAFYILISVNDGIF